MHAIVATRALPNTDPLAFETRELADPSPGDQDLLIRVEALAVNPVDTKVRASLPLEPGAARILGWDGAGVVEAVGGAVRGFSPGDSVFFAGDITRPGCYAQKVLVDSRLCGFKPASLSFGEAAALPLTSLTAWEALFERVGLDSEGSDAGRSLLILGGAGGVGSMVVQLAKAAGPSRRLGRYRHGLAAGKPRLVPSTGGKPRGRPQPTPGTPVNGPGLQRSRRDRQFQQYRRLLERDGGVNQAPGGNRMHCGQQEPHRSQRAQKQKRALRLGIHVHPPAIPHR